MLIVGEGDIRKVYRAYLSGCRNTGDVAATTGLTVQRAASYSIRLVQRGVLRAADPARPVVRRMGRPYRWYEPIQNSVGVTV